MKDNTECAVERAAWEAFVRLPGRGLRISTTPKVIKRANCMLTMSYNLESSCQMPRSYM